MCLVSVIVPVYQVEAYLSACLDSILAQTFTDFELILVNDGTKDNCPQIMAAYAEKDERIRQIHKQNGGLSSARNAGLDIAKGKYIAFVDSDDTIEPTLLEDAVKAAEETDADQVLFNYRMVDANGVHNPYLDIADEVIDLNKLGLANYFYQYWMPYKHGQEAWTKLYRREIIEAHGLRYAPNNEIFAEDTLFSAMYLLHTKKIAALSGAYVNYLQRGDSLMGMKKPQLARRLMTLSIRLCDYANKVGKWPELKHVLPVLCYDKLICKGIRLDPSIDDVHAAMTAMLKEETMEALLRSLRGVMPLIQYTLHTGKGIRTQVRARIFADRWLRGDVMGAAALVDGREEKQ